jgi:hypothetical protein
MSDKKEPVDNEFVEFFPVSFATAHTDIVRLHAPLDFQVVGL